MKNYAKILFCFVFKHVFKVNQQENNLCIQEFRFDVLDFLTIVKQILYLK